MGLAKKDCVIKLLTFTLSLLAFVCAAATFAREYGVAYLARGSELAAFNTLAYDAGVSRLPLSSRGMRELFSACARVQQGLIYSLQPSETRAAVDEACADMSRRALDRNPTYSAAYAILMLSSSEPEDVGRFLALSQMTAPRESWHAKLRLQTGLPLYASGAADLDRAVEADIGFFSQTSWGSAWLADMYRKEVSVRPAIVGVLDTRPDDEKAAFLEEVRRRGQD